ncbi:MAG: hypothetical protein ACXWNX_15175 [Isosphaeraceae bacterium]
MPLSCYEDYSASIGRIAEGRRGVLSREVGRLADDIEVVDRERLERRSTRRPHHAELELVAGWNRP